MAELTFELEKQFRIQVDDEVLEVETVGELVNYVRSKVPK
jgi:acyl carrier protein